MKYDKDIWGEIDSIHAINSNDIEISRKVYQLVNKIYLLLNEDKGDKANFYCALGYIGYHFNNLLEFPIDIIENLNQSIQFDSDLITAWLYLGYSYFDKHDWANSLNSFNYIDDVFYNSLVDELKFKIQELKICCIMHIERPKSIPVEARKYIEHLNNSSMREIYYPIELVRLISNADYIDRISKITFLEQIRSIQ